MGTDTVINKRIAVTATKPHPRNYNKHDETQVEDLRESLRQFGQVRSVVVQAAKRNGDYLTVAGHGIIEAAKLEGMTRLRADVIPASWSPARVLAYLAADNELARRGSPDEMQLAVLVAEVQEREGDALARLAAGEKRALDRLLALARNGDGQADTEPQMDRAEELNRKWKVKTGDMFAIGEHRLLCGDSTRREDVERVMGGERARLVVTDPPYGVAYADKNKFLNAISPANRVETPIENDHQSKEETQKMWKAAFAEMSAVMDGDAVVYCFMPQGGDQMMMMMMMGAGIEPRHELIWLKNNHVLGRVDYAYKHEPILYAWKAGGHRFYGDFQTSILECNKPQISELHPTTKPVELVERLLENSSRKSEIVYDGFVGSGTCIIACQNLNRRCRAIEISPAYCAVVLQRMADAFPGITIERIEHGEAKRKPRGKATDQAKKGS